MKNTSILRGLLILAVAFGLTSLPAQTPAGTGVITGRVQNVGNARYLNNARISIVGTNRETFTNSFGDYRLTDVPAGEVKVQASFEGLDPETTTVTVAGGQTATYDFNLTSVERYGDDKVVKLDTFVVQSNREYEGNALAVNEQRNSGNIKVVVSSDAFGDINEGNPGEFLKFLPGITVDYVAADVRTVSVRGFPSNFTNVYWDGMRLTSSASGASNRIFEFEQVSINNTSRTEVTKVPTPDFPADSLGGNINFISKNAFERKGAKLNYRVYMNMNSEDKSLTPTPGPTNKKTTKVMPNFDFDYTLPVNKKFGLVITGLSSNQFNEQHRWQPTWNYQQGAGTYTPTGGSLTTVVGGTPAAPYLQQWQLQDGPKITHRASFGTKADWKITDTQTLSVAVQENFYHSVFGNRNLNFNVGTSGTPTPVNATNNALSFGPDFVTSAFGRASVTQGSSFRDKYGNTEAINLHYNLDLGDWSLDAGLHAANSKTWYRAVDRGHFANVGTTLQGVSVVKATGIAFPTLNWQALSATGSVVDPYSLANYRIGTLTDDPIDGLATMRGGFANLIRHFDSGAIPFSIKVGVNNRTEGRDNRRYANTRTFLGADGVANTADDSALPYLDSAYSGQNPYWSSPNIQWVDAYKLGQELRDHPGYFRLGTGTNQDGVEAETFRINNSEKMEETVNAGYVQLEGRLLQNKLHFITGVRYEHTTDKGQGVLSDPDAVWQRNADGSYVDGSPLVAGVQRVRRVDAGTVGSLQELALIRIERGYKDEKSYDGYYPSLHLTYDIRKDLLVRFAYAKTMGRPDYANIIPNTDINENDTDPNAAGTITIRNTGLKPWTADNFDLSLEYYYKGGVASIGVFKKNISDFWQNYAGTVDQALADQLGLDSRYVGWGVSTQVNGGDADINGVEFNLVRPLTFLPGFGRYLTVKANGTALHVGGAQTADFRGFIDKAGNLSLSYNRSPVVFNINLNYRGRQKGTVITGPALQTGAQYGATTGFYEYYAPRVNVDLSAEYKISKQFSIFAGARNIFNKEQIIQRYSDVSPAYSAGFRQEEFGIQLSMGVKGSF
jgi:TonB-dependent receptor